MLIYHPENNHIVATTWSPEIAIPPNTLWIDMLSPTKEEELAVEVFLGISIPTREEMREIEVSSRLYQENDALIMTATMLSKVDSGAPETHAVTFIVADKQLVTVRYIDTTSFRRFSARILKFLPEKHSGATLFLELFDSVVDRLADILERLDHDIERVTKLIFRSSNAPERKESIDYQEVLERIGRCGDLSSKSHESLVTLGRVAVYALSHKRMSATVKEARLQSISRDIDGLKEHGNYLTGKVNFLLDATLGMISIEQNTVFKILSVASLIFMPPTLVAGIYGMNFKLMPELEWHWGYPIAIGLMLLAGILPLAYLRKKKWL
jgi:magnesium transporter